MNYKKISNSRPLLFSEQPKINNIQSDEGNSQYKNCVAPAVVCTGGSTIAIIIITTTSELLGGICLGITFAAACVAGVTEN